VSAEELLDAVSPSLVAGDPMPIPETVDDVDPAEVATIAGTYRLETGGSFDVTARDDRLAIAASGTDAVAALFPSPSDYTADDVSRHEQRVLALLAGETQEGREEREALESDIGPIDDIELAGTIVDDGELRTYVTITSGAESIALWYALDEQGGIAAALLVDEPPTLLLGSSGSGGYRPDDPTGTGPDLAVEFEDGHMTVTGPDGSTEARLAG
jgi:hypothetical protein